MTRRRSASRASPRSDPAVTWLTSIDESRSRSSPSISPAALIRPASESPASRSRKQPRLTPVSTTSRWPCAARRRISVQHRVRRPAAGRAADEGDDAERTRERAAVLDLHERADPVEAVLRLDAADRTDIACDGVGDLLAAAERRPVTLSGIPAKPPVERFAAQPGHVDALVRPGCPSSRLARLGDGFVRDAARVDHGDVTPLLVTSVCPSASSRSRIACSSANDTLQPRNRVVKVAIGLGA